MKKKLVLLPLLLLGLTACDGLNLNDLMGGNNGGNNNNANSAEVISKAPVDPNDVAIKISNMFSIFPEIGDELDLSEYISFDTGTNYKLSDFTFEALNPQVISVNNYHAVCKKQGFAMIRVSGPGLNTPVELSFYVGSIAGTYKPDSSTLSSVINLNIVEGAEGYSFSLRITPTERVKTYNKRDINPYEGGGSLIKNISPFLPMQFNGAAPSTFEPVTKFITDLVPDAEEVVKDLTDDVYGLMTADPDYGLILKMRFNEKFIDLIVE